MHQGVTRSPRVIAHAEPEVETRFLELLARDVRLARHEEAGFCNDAASVWGGEEILGREEDCEGPLERCRGRGHGGKRVGWRARRCCRVKHEGGTFGRVECECGRGAGLLCARATLREAAQGAVCSGEQEAT